MTTCTICVTAIEDDVAALPCRHTFHTYCINRWFNQKTSCPNCNKHFHRNSIIGPLYLEDAATLKSTTASTNDQNNRGVDPAEVLILRQQLAESHKINGHLQRRIVYYKSARNLIRLQKRMKLKHEYVNGWNWIKKV
ncbi:hypothetical protein BDC45DRAFT_42859 [Circinella umbellata]|nr:hypothetical protein BDC45DRAFT_42859 [Circinella umbellata]